MSSAADRSDHRRFPRIARVAEGDILRVVAASPVLHHVVTRDVSAGGFRFATTEPVIPPGLFLAHVDDAVLQGLSREQDQWLRMGDDYLARSVWISKLPTSGLYEIGARFALKGECSLDELAIFTNLLNYRTLESLPGTRY